MHGSVIVAAAASETVAVDVAVPDSATGGANRLSFGVSFAGADGEEVSCTHEIVDVSTATLASLIAAEAGSYGVRIEWLTAADVPVTVQRHRAVTGWSDLEVVQPVRGRVRVEDRQVEPGEWVGYRLRWSDAGGEVVAGETWIEVPVSARLALLGIRPNPARQEMTAAFSLPAAGRATLELYDVSGRRVARRELSLGEGNHVMAVAPNTRLAPGVYMLQLTFGGNALRTRAVVID